MANTVLWSGFDGRGLYAKRAERAECDRNGKPIDTTYLDKDSILVTARKQYGTETYVPDRSFEKLAESIDNGITPVLRVISGSDVSYCVLVEYNGSVMVFRAPMDCVEEPDGDNVIVKTEFRYSVAEFKNTSKEVPMSGVDIGLIDIGE